MTGTPKRKRTNLKILITLYYVAIIINLRRYKAISQGIRKTNYSFIIFANQSVDR
ncbi:MAG: hypothetical protein Roseis2KO_55070 [Roseivirga sp.]